jgi:glycosyltransferase involved in cell wall biosynthesis
MTTIPSAFALAKPMGSGLIVGVDASRNRSGGARAHLAGLIAGADPRDHGIEAVHLWAYRSLGDQVQDRPWLTKHHPPELERSMVAQLRWQYQRLPVLVRELQCDILFNTDAGTICPVAQSATLSQDMLSFEPGEMRRYSGLARLRLEILKHTQRRSLSRSRLAIYLTEYARQMIGKTISAPPPSVVIPHGIDKAFRADRGSRRTWPSQGPIRCLYVSNAAPYKHQWNVVEAVSLLRQEGHDFELTLVGGGEGPARERLERSIADHDPERSFVRLLEFVPNSTIPDLLFSSDIFVFASSCENLPITMLEAMASGIPICASDRGPMPEVLGDGGIYFDPESALSIARAIRQMTDDGAGRARLAQVSETRSRAFTWERCADETWRELAAAATRR